MATHKRSRTGCWTCREAGYKCDETKPFCGRCTRLMIICKGYGVKLKWQDNGFSTPAKPPRKSRKKKASKEEQQISTPLSSSSPPTTLGTPSDVTSSPESTYSLPFIPLWTPQTSPDLSTNDRWLLHYWIEHLSSMISVAPRKGPVTPFQIHLTSMTYDSAALRSTVLSMAATHLAQASNDSSLYLRAYRHQRDAIHELQKCLQHPHATAYEPALATVLMMQVSARLFGDDDEATVANHLIGARAMIAQHGATEAHQHPSSERFLRSLFAYHDILSSVSRGAQPLLDHTASFAAVEGEEELKSIADVLLVVARISSLQHAIKSRRMNSEVATTALTEDEDATGRQIQQALLSMDFDASRCHEESMEESDIRATAQAYRHAAFIYLYRTWLDIGAPNPISMDHIHRCLEDLSRVHVQSPLSAAHMWPLFTAGCEAIDSTERQFVRTRFADMYGVKRFPSLKRVMRDIEDVWAAKDMEQEARGKDGMAKVDCIQVILRRRGREVDLA